MIKMTSPLVGAATPIEHRARPAYEPPKRTVGRVTPVPTAQAAEIRLIYFDETRASFALEQIASTDAGRKTLLPITDVDMNGVFGPYNRRSIFLQLATKVDGVGVTDLETGEAVEALPEHLYPEQLLAISGNVWSAQDVKPTSLRLSAGNYLVRVYVERAHFLHLNQSYLTRSTLTVMGAVRSVPRLEMCAVAIFSISDQSPI